MQACQMNLHVTYHSTCSTSSCYLNGYLTLTLAAPCTQGNCRSCHCDDCSTVVRNQCHCLLLVDNIRRCRCHSKDRFVCFIRLWSDQLQLCLACYLDYRYIWQKEPAAIHIPEHGVEYPGCWSLLPHPEFLKGSSGTYGGIYLCFCYVLLARYVNSEVFFSYFRCLNSQFLLYLTILTPS
jgi:hypothetical protein